MGNTTLETTAFLPDFADGEEVLAFHRGKWRHVRWAGEKWHLGYGEPFIRHTADRAYAPLPPIPVGAAGFYDFKE